MKKKAEELITELLEYYKRQLDDADSEERMLYRVFINQLNGILVDLKNS